MVRLILLAQKPIGAQAFKIVSTEPRIRIVAVVTNVLPGGWWGTADVAADARRLGIPVIDNDRRNEGPILDAIAGGADFLLSVQHPWILSRTLIEAGPALNLHLGPLPEYRGFFGPTHAILEGATTYGATLHWLAPEVDSGDIALEARFPIEPLDTALSLYNRAEIAGSALVTDLVHRLAAVEAIPRRKQAAGGRAYGRLSLDNLREIRPGDDVDRKARAFFFPPHDPAYRVVEGVRIPVLPGSSGPGRDRRR